MADSLLKFSTIVAFGQEGVNFGMPLGRKLESRRNADR
jgi:hypothetical protein